MKTLGLSITFSLLVIFIKNVDAGDPSPCRDSKSRFTVGNEKTTCEWAKRKDTTSRCKNKIIKRKCPKTCGICTKDGSDENEKKGNNNKNSTGKNGNEEKKNNQKNQNEVKRKKKNKNKNNKTQTRKICRWAKRKDTANRCQTRKVKRHCKAICSNKNEKDNEQTSNGCRVMKEEKGRFQVDFGEGKISKKSCGWAIQKDVVNRCMHAKVQKKCTESCKVCLEHISDQEGEEVPEQETQEEDDQEVVGDIEVEEGEDDQSEIRTINERECQNNKEPFAVTLEVVNGEEKIKSRNCRWARGYSGACFYKEVQENCPKLCDTCYSASTASTKSPTTAPTKIPTTKPSTSTPTLDPTITPTGGPTEVPTEVPTSSSPSTALPVASVQVSTEGLVDSPSYEEEIIITSVTEEDPTIQVINGDYRTQKVVLGMFSLPIWVTIVLSFL